MNTRSSFETVQVNGIDTVDGPLVVSEDTSHFTKSNRKGPNLATYYFKHEDTDSDMEKIQKNTSTAIVESEEQSMLGETSDEEWVFNRNMSRQGCELESSNAESSCSKSKLISEETIKRLVQNVEELVSPDKSKNIEIIHSLNKMSRVKQWLSINKPEDSCDASGEDDEKESQVSEDADESLTTSKTVHACSSQNTSFTECSSDSTPKVQMRQRKYTSNRPWSVSCILQLEPSKGMNSTITSYSNSESALHNINLTPKNIEDFNASSVQTIGVNGNNSTSSTMEDSYNILTEEKASPNRRRRLKMRRKCLNKSQINKVETNNRLFKSSSYSGQSNNPALNERQTSSDPPAVSIYTSGKYETTSGADTDDSAFKRLPAFKIGSKTSYLSTDLRDNSPGKSSLNTAEEQSSSLSEQAWDSYQEKYLSEAYSETHDSDAARKLLEFGEDYRNFIDSQSDWSTNADISPSFPRRTLIGAPNIIDQDSDSDTESFRHLMNSSREQLVYTQRIYQQQVSLGLKQYLETNDISEMLSTCDRHVDLLNHIDQIAGKCVSREDKKAATGRSWFATILSYGWSSLIFLLKMIVEMFLQVLRTIFSKRVKSD